jgi:hypothetical protein
MKLFDRLIKAPRWVASSLFGKKGRDFVDRYDDIINQAVSFFYPMVDLQEHDIFNSVLNEYAKKHGIPLSDREVFAKIVKDRLKV